MSQSSVLFANTCFHKTDLLLKRLDWRPAYTGQRIKQDMGNICPISDVLVLSFAIIKDWIGCTAVSGFLKPEREWEETEIKVYKRKKGKRERIAAAFWLAFIKGKRPKGCSLGWGPGRGLGCGSSSSWVAMLSPQRAPLPCHAGGVTCRNAGEGGSCRTSSSPEHLPRDSASLHQRGFNPPVTDVVQRKGTGFNKRAK